MVVIVIGTDTCDMVILDISGFAAAVRIPVKDCQNGCTKTSFFLIDDASRFVLGTFFLTFSLNTFGALRTCLALKVEACRIRVIAGSLCATIGIVFKRFDACSRACHCSSRAPKFACAVLAGIAAFTCLSLIVRGRRIGIITAAFGTAIIHVGEAGDAYAVT